MSDAAVTITKPLICTKVTVDMLIEEPLVVHRHSNAASSPFAYSEHGAERSNISAQSNQFLSQRPSPNDQNARIPGCSVPVFGHCSSNQELAKHVAPLIKLVVIQQSSLTPQTIHVDIWRAMLDLIARRSSIPHPITRPLSRPSFTSSF